MKRAKQTVKNFDQVKVILPMIFMSLGFTMVILRSETLLYINTSYPGTSMPKKLLTPDETVCVEVTQRMDGRIDGDFIKMLQGCLAKYPSIVLSPHV